PSLPFNAIIGASQAREIFSPPTQIEFVVAGVCCHNNGATTDCYAFPTTKAFVATTDERSVAA
ncbi:MAG: hypothetical protein LUD52_05490, partial [Opitutae bacterium]|nr:hypothetical protein [Opitutae bacterium]